MRKCVCTDHGCGACTGGCSLTSGELRQIFEGVLIRSFDARERGEFDRIAALAAGDDNRG